MADTGTWQVVERCWIVNPDGMTVAKTTGNIGPYSESVEADERAARRIIAALNDDSAMRERIAQLEEALVIAHGISLPSRWKKWPKCEAKVLAALPKSGGAE